MRCSRTSLDMVASASFSLQHADQVFGRRPSFGDQVAEFEFAELGGVLHAADVAAVAAIGGGQFVPGALPFLAQEGLGDAGGDVHPGEAFPEVAFAVAVEGGIEAVFGHRVPPEVFAEVFAPGVEAGAVAPGGLDHRCEATVASGEDAFED